MILKNDVNPLKDLLYSRFDPDRYEKDPISEILELPEDIKSKLSRESKQMLTQEGQFKFKLNSYPGKNNKVKTIAYDAENIIYHGQVRDDLDELKTVKEGKGYLLKHRNLYCGYFAKDKFAGPGIYVYHDADADEVCYYFGYWVDDQIVGKGIIHHLSGFVYRGEMKESVQEGYGEERWPDNSTYKGDFKKGYKWGHGELVWSDKARYIGEFKEGAFDGVGEFFWEEGNKYSGQWKNGLMDDTGKFTWADCTIYDGGYLLGKKHGKGVLHWPNGTRWEGIWNNGKKSGDGKFFNEENIQVASLNISKKY